MRKNAKPKKNQNKKNACFVSLSSSTIWRLNLQRTLSGEPFMNTMSGAWCTSCSRRARSSDERPCGADGALPAPVPAPAAGFDAASAPAGGVLICAVAGAGVRR